MYEAFYGFKSEPFRLSPDAAFCYRHGTYKKAKAYMQYALHRGEGFVMVTGQPGTGKSTLINDLVSEFSTRDMAYASIVSTQLQADDLLRMVVYGFGIESTSDYKSALLQRLQEYLIALQHYNKRALLIIDEAQDLSDNALEELRLLTNLQKNGKPLLQIFLVGQEGLRDMVLSPHLAQLHQRIIAACHLQPLNSEATEAYIQHRLSVVGWKNNPQIDQGVYGLIYDFSLGIPRWINLICSRLLLSGMVEEKHHLTVSDVLSITDDLIHEQLLPHELEANLNEIRSNYRTHSVEEQDEVLIESSENVSAYSVSSDPPISRVSSHSSVSEFEFHRQNRSITPNRRELVKQDLTDRVSGGQTSAVLEGVNSGLEDELPSRRRTTRVLISNREKQPLDSLKDQIAKKLYKQLAPMLFGKSKGHRLRIFQNFINGLEIDGTVLSVPLDIFNTSGSVGFMVWLESNSHNLDRDMRDILWALFELVDQ